MKIKRKAKRLVAKSLVLAMLLLSLSGAYPARVSAQDKSNEVTAISLNCVSKNLKLGYDGAASYDFNVIGSKELIGASYSWYIVADKGNPKAVTIDENSGIVTAKEAGTAYIGCKVTLLDGTILQAEAKVYVINNISGVEIGNLPEAMTIKAGYPTNFSISITDTKAGKGKPTEGITRLEISDDSAGVGEADDLGVVFPTREGQFTVRAVSFQNDLHYRLWKANKERYEHYITAASQWHIISVAPSDGSALVSTKQQLDKALAVDGPEVITLSTDKEGVFVIEPGDYSSVSFVVDAPNADVKNYATFKDITIKAIKDSTWIEYADGNIIYLEDTQLSLLIDSDADIKEIVIDTPDAEINLEIRGKVGVIRVLQPSNINISGSADSIAITVEEGAKDSTISTSLPVQMTLQADISLTLKEGSEGTTIDKSNSSIEVKVDNKSNNFVKITNNKAGIEIVPAQSTGISNESTTQDIGKQPNIEVTELRIVPNNMVLSVSGSSISMFVARTTPEYTTDTITWRSNDESVAIVDEYGIVTPTGLGTALVIASTGNIYALAQVTVVSGSALNIEVEDIRGGLQSIGATMATELGKGAASYVGGQLMGWGLKEAGIGFEDATTEQLNKMTSMLNQLSSQIKELEAKLDDVVSQISKQILDSEYNTRVGQMGALIGHIKSIRDELNRFVSNPIKNNPELLERSREEILTNIKNHLISNENLIHNQLVGIGSQESLIKVFSRAVRLNHRFLSYKDSEKVQVMFDYFEAVQTNMLELMIEYYHAIGEGGDNTNNIDRLLDTFNKNIEEQRKLMLKPLPEDLIIDTKFGTMNYSGDYYSYTMKYKNGKFMLVAIPGSGPYYNNWNGFHTALERMCYTYGYNNWRVAGIYDYNSWKKESKGQNLQQYLVNNGWVGLKMDAGKKIGIIEYGLNSSIYGIPVDASVTGYYVGSGEKGIIIYNIRGGSFEENEIIPVVYKAEANDNDPINFYWIVTRALSTNEISKYFY